MKKSSVGFTTRAAAALLGIVILSGCATTKCTPTPITVAKKEQRLRTELKTVGTRTTSTGAVEDVTQQVSVREYWVQAADGGWHQITEQQYEVAVPNVTLEICR